MSRIARKLFLLAEPDWVFDAHTAVAADTALLACGSLSRQAILPNLPQTDSVRSSGFSATPALRQRELALSIRESARKSVLPGIVAIHSPMKMARPLDLGPGRD
jgi:hypothetical protein